MEPAPLPRALTPEQQRVKESNERRVRMGRALDRIRHKIIVLSGKGGVGKTTVAVNLATTLARRGWKVGLLDMDLTGPDVPYMLGLEGQRLKEGPGLIVPFQTREPPMKVLSIAFLLQDTPVVWRGPLKTHALTQFLGDVDWGDLDFLIVDLPPGTGDEALAVTENLPDADGILLVSTPQGVSTLDVRKALQFGRLVQLRILGVVENMSGFTCPHCGETTDLFGRGGARALAEKETVRFLGAVPLDPLIMRRAEEGVPFVRALEGTPSAHAFDSIVDGLLEAVSEPSRPPA